MTQAEEYSVAVHEAGHAVMGFLCRRGVKSITCVPNEDKGYLGCCYGTDSERLRSFAQRGENGEASAKEIRNYFRSRIAGEVAGQLVLGEEWTLGGSDLDGFLSVLGSAGLAYILGESVPPREKMEEMVKNYEIYRDEWVSGMINETIAMMEPHVNAINAIADKLIQRKTISGRLARKIFKEYERKASVTQAKEGF